MVFTNKIDDLGYTIANVFSDCSIESRIALHLRPSLGATATAGRILQP